MDSKTLQTLEFDKVLAHVAAFANFSGGEALALALIPVNDYDTALRWQQQTAEAVALFDSQREVTIGGARDVRRPADNAQRGFTLLATDFLEIRNTLLAAATLRTQLLRDRHENPELARIAKLIEDCPGLAAKIELTLDERGEILDSASVKLANLRKALRIAHGRIQDKLQRLLNSDLNQHLQESIITQRGGRYVVPVRADAKGRIRGIVHDQSGSGATLWIEPIGMVELNNEYRGLQAQEAEEINRILAALSAEVAANGEALKRIVDRIAEIDLIFAKAKYAAAINGIMPALVAWKDYPPPAAPKHANQIAKRQPPPYNPHPGSTIWIRGARHPLLPAANVVPVDWTLDEESFIALITGPNTGGKTVSLKTLGLMALMAQSGLHLPAIEAKLTVFEHIFADIGDEQSIEQNLSTFSGHITNVIRILNKTNDRSLVLLDELGSGTDPAEGAALAQAIISFLRDAGSVSIVATHYPELKIYASQTSGAVNASLHFDVDTLAPTYELNIGLPGRSNALVIARRLGLNDTVLDEAMKLVGSGSAEAEALLDSIEELRERIASQEAASRIALKRVEQARDELAARLAQIEEERYQTVEKAREQADEELEALRDEIRRIRQRLRDAGSRTAVKKLNQEVTQLEEQGLDLPAFPKPAPPKKRRRQNYEVGDIVQVTSLQTKGEIAEIHKEEAVVSVGRLHMRVRFEDLELRERPPVEEIQPASSAKEVIVPSPGIELDIRGHRVEEGLEALDRRLDQAFLASLPWIRVVHGKGTGRLRQAVRQALSAHPNVNSWEEGRDGEGDSGVTVAKLKVD